MRVRRCVRNEHLGDNIQPFSPSELHRHLRLLQCLLQVRVAVGWRRVLVRGEAKMGQRLFSTDLHPYRSWKLTARAREVLGVREAGDGDTRPPVLGCFGALLEQLGQASHNLFVASLHVVVVCCGALRG
jgi:hypothetical protein